MWMNLKLRDSLAQRKHLSGKNDYEKLVRFLATKGIFIFYMASSVAKDLG